MSKKTTHVRIDRMLVDAKRIKFPQYTPNDIFKIGLSVVSGIEHTGKFIYGNAWKTKKK